MRKKERAFYVSVKNLQQKKCNNHKLLKLASPKKKKIKKYEMKDLKKVTKRGEKNVEKHILYTMHNTYRLVCFNFIFSSTEEEKKEASRQ